MPTSNHTNDRPTPISTRRPFVRGVNQTMHLTVVPTTSGARGANIEQQRMTRRAFGSTMPREHTAMYSVHQGPSLPHLYAEARRQELLAEAEQARRVSQLAPRGASRRSGVASAVAMVRRQVGSALVRAGERVQGVGGEPARDALPSIGTLRAAR